MQGTEGYICAICCEAYNQSTNRPLRLACGHALCLACFTYAYNDQAKVTCGRCSKATFSNQQTPDHTISAYMKALAVLCSKCVRNTATRYCRLHDEAMCEQCVRSAKQCDLVELQNEDFNLKHHLYQRIKTLRETLKPQLLSPYLSQIAMVGQLTSQQRLALLGSLLQAETTLFCFFCANAAVSFHTQRLTLCCAQHAQGYVGFVALKTNSREELLRQLKTFAHHFLATTTNSFFDPSEAKMRSVFTALRSPTISNLATTLYRLSKMLEARLDYQHTNYIQCPICFRVSLFTNFPMRRLPCASAVHLICQACYETHKNSLECPFDGQKIDETAVITYQTHY
jgi:hypothetical protein